MVKVTESDSSYRHLEKMSARALLVNMNREDRKVAVAVANAIGTIELLVNVIVKKMKAGGRLFYLGAGTSGRIGIIDASECPPTYGVPQGLVIGIIAGGDSAIRKAVEFAEDDVKRGWKDLRKHKITSKDVVIGISASGTTPYVAGALKKCNMRKITSACITCNPNSPVALAASYPIEVIVGAEFVTGSTRMKAGTAQKLVLNMISTAVMIKLGHVRGNKMVDMQLTNNKLVDRGTKMIMHELEASRRKANELLHRHGSVRKAVDASRPGRKPGSLAM